MQETYSLRFRDRLLLTVVTVVICLPSAMVDHAATFHEAALAQSLHEMSASGRWLTPTVGGQTWLKSLPFVQWFGQAAMIVLGLSNALVAVRLTAIVPLGLATLWTASLAAASSGRRSGVLAGFILLTTMGVAQSIWHAGTTIWLVAAACGLMNLLARLESHTHARRHSARPISAADVLRREPVSGVLAVFVLLGLTTMIAGPFEALATILLPAAGHVFWRRGRVRKISNPWHTGWLLTAAIGTAWLLTARSLSSDTTAAWLRVDPFESFAAWSFATWQPAAQLWQLVQMSLPWGPLAAFGLWSIRHDALAGSYSRERLLVLWSLAVPTVLFLLMPSRMELALAAAGAWSISAAIGVDRLTHLIFRELPMLETRQNRAILQKFLAGTAAVLTLSIVWHDFGTEQRQVDSRLLADARAAAEEGYPVFVDMHLGEQAGLLLLDLGDLATPLPQQDLTTLEPDAIVISSRQIQESRRLPRTVAADQRAASENGLILLRVQNLKYSESAQIAALPVPSTY